jgi:hypothetical protein
VLCVLDIILYSLIFYRNFISCIHVIWAFNTPDTLNMKLKSQKHSMVSH